MKITIVIISFNGMTWIKKCLASCGGNKVIIVDNNSSDGTVKYVEKNYPKVILLCQNENLGFGAANNIGIAYALKEGADYVFLLNQDAYLQTHTIDTLIKVYKNNRDYGVISPIHLNGDGSKLDKNFSSYIKASDKLFFDSLKGKYSNEIYEVPFVNAAAWLLPRKTIETIGGFDPIFYHYGEDDNYCQRVLFHNIKIGVVPNTYINHDREEKKPNYPINEKDKLALKERYFKYRWANINIEIDKDVRRNKKDLLKLITKLYLKLQFNKALYYQKELALINRIIPEIYKSRAKNSRLGPHYI